jgi:mono/diheme cytochrome c family protein
MSRFPEFAAVALAAFVFAAPAALSGEGKIGLGRVATASEVAGWDIDVRPDGLGLPPGKGTVTQGEALFIERCSACHGEFGQGNDRWPVLAGGQGSLKSDRPEKTIGSYWPVASTIYDYVRRAMPYGSPQTQSPDEIYALVAYLLYLNDVIKETDFELNAKNLASIKLPNADGFFDDDRETSEKAFWKKSVCMKDCKTSVQITGHASILDVTPDGDKKHGSEVN